MLPALHDHPISYGCKAPLYHLLSSYHHLLSSNPQFLSEVFQISEATQRAKVFKLRLKLSMLNKYCSQSCFKSVWKASLDLTSRKEMWPNVAVRRVVLHI